METRNECAFKIGDVVVLRSGGPRMTATAIEGNGFVTCTWIRREAMTASAERLPPEAIMPCPEAHFE